MSKPISMITLTLVMSAIRPVAADQWSHFLVGENVRRIQYDELNKIYWFGTDSSGLWRFDGQQFEHINPDSININRVNALAIDAKDDVLWVGTPNGLYRFHFKTNVWEYFDKGSGLSENSIIAVFVDRRGILWYGSEDLSKGDGGGGVGKRDSTGWYRYTTSEYAKWDSGWVRIEGVDPIPSEFYNTSERNYVDCIAQDGQDNLLFGSRGAGVCILDQSTKFWHPSFVSFPETGDYWGYVRAIAVDRAGNKWLGTREGVCRLDRANNLREWFTPKSGLVGIPVNAIWIEADEGGENKWFGSFGGASMLDSTNRRWENFTNENSNLGAKGVQDIIVDNDGNIWFALFNAKGVSRFIRYLGWSALKTTDGLSSNFAFAVATDQTGRLWAGTDHGGVEIRSGNNWIKQPLEACEYLPAVTDFLRVDSVMWVASQCGIFKIAPNLSVTCRIAKNRPQRFPSNDVRAIAVRNDTLWAGTYRDGLARIVGCDAAAKLDTIFLRDRQITALAYDHRGRLWAGTTRGIYVFDGSAFFLTALPGFDPEVAITVIARDSTEVMWVGTGFGIAQFDGEKWTRFSTADGLPDDRITAIKVAPGGEVWCGTINGAAVYRSDTWIAFTTETTGDGLSDDYIFDLAFGPEEVVWFATNGGGISRYRQNNVAPQTFLFESFKIVTESSISFRYSGHDAKTDSANLRYQYALDNPSRWFIAPANNVTLSIAEGGLYTFRVRAIDEDGNVDASPARVRFQKISAQQGRTISVADSTLWPRLDSLSLYVPPATMPEGSSICVNQVNVDINAVAKQDKRLHFSGIAFSLVPQAENIWHATNKRPITLKIFYDDSIAREFEQSQLVIYRWESKWIPHGGVVDPERRVIGTAITQLDTFALFEMEGAMDELPLADLSNFAAQPRILSREFAQTVQISFDLGKHAEVTAKIYNLAGRLVQVLRENEPMIPGHHAIEWNGSDHNGEHCPSGLYVICLEAAGGVKTKTVMVSNR